MSGSTRRRRVDASYRSAHSRSNRFPPRSMGITTAKAKAKTESVLSALALEKKREYERKKQELVAFTEKVMKKKITAAAKKYITDNLDTVYDFISQLEHHPSVERAFPIEGLVRRNQNGLRVLVDLKLPKTTLPGIDPIPPELLSQFQTKIKSHIMDFVKTTPTTKRRIFIDIFHNTLYQVEDIKAPQDPYFGAAAEYYSTFSDAHLGVRSADTRLQSIPLIQSGLKDDLLLSILENLNGKNYCTTRVFNKVCDKLRGSINQTTRELRPFVSFPERADSPDPENPDPMRDGVVKNSIKMMEFLPIFLSNFYTYLDTKLRSGVAEPEKVIKMRNILMLLSKLLKSAPTTDGTRGPPYYFDKVLKVGVKLNHLMPLLDILNTEVRVTIFKEFCKADSGFKLYLKHKITRTSFNFDDPRILSAVVIKLLGHILKNKSRVGTLELRVIHSRPELKHLLTLNLESDLEPVVARATEIPTSSVLNIPPSEVSRLPDDEIVVSAELAEISETDELRVSNEVAGYQLDKRNA